MIADDRQSQNKHQKLRLHHKHILELPMITFGYKYGIPTTD
jgi:RNase adaptor protein for sRNA GlmZ degradation